jgi:hypothetical protein
MERTKAFERKPSGMPQMSFQKDVEGWASVYTFGGSATISLSGLLLQIFEVLAVQSHYSLFFFKKLRMRLKRRLPLE